MLGKWRLYHLDILACNLETVHLHNTIRTRAITYNTSFSGLLQSPSVFSGICGPHWRRIMTNWDFVHLLTFGSERKSQVTGKRSGIRRCERFYVVSLHMASG